MTKIDVFAHVLMPDFYEKMLMLDKELPTKMPFILNPVLTDMAKRRETMPADTRQLSAMSTPIQRIIYLGKWLRSW